MVVDEALTAMTLVKKPQVVTAQIHDSSNDIIEILADDMGNHVNADGSFGICVRLNGIEQSTCLDNHYVLGTRYVVNLVATGGHIIIYYNGVKKFDFAQSGSGWYFKSGSYVQSNTTTKGFDASGAYGRVTIYGLQVTHS
jgi:Alginate lyase